MSKMTKQEKEEWNELCDYVKLEILKYDNSIKFPKHMVLRLKGLKDGKFIANKNTQSQGNYSFSEILMTFKINKILILNSTQEVNKFKDETHKINYIMAIIESKINDVCDKIRTIELQKIKSQSIEINLNEEKANYKHKTKEVKNSRLKGLL